MSLVLLKFGARPGTARLSDGAKRLAKVLGSFSVLPATERLTNHQQLYNHHSATRSRTVLVNKHYQLSIIDYHVKHI